MIKYCTISGVHQVLDSVKKLCEDADLTDVNDMLSTRSTPTDSSGKKTSTPSAAAKFNTERRAASMSQRVIPTKEKASDELVDNKTCSSSVKPLPVQYVNHSKTNVKFDPRNMLWNQYTMSYIPEIAKRISNYCPVSEEQQIWTPKMEQCDKSYDDSVVANSDSKNNSADESEDGEPRDNSDSKNNSTGESEDEPRDNSDSENNSTDESEEDEPRDNSESENNSTDESEDDEPADNSDSESNSADEADDEPRGNSDSKSNSANEAEEKEPRDNSDSENNSTNESGVDEPGNSYSGLQNLHDSSSSDEFPDYNLGTSKHQGARLNKPVQPSTSSTHGIHTDVSPFSSVKFSLFNYLIMSH